MVQCHVGHAEEQLPQHRQAGLKGSGRADLLEQIFRQRRARFVVGA
jgi:hypothetical protein